MKPPRRGLAPLFRFACLWLVASSAGAVTPRAYVSVSGSDANTCSDPATPCRTFVGAIAQVASGGEVLVLTSGTFGGGTIAKSVTINAPAGVVAVVATPIIVNAASAVVTLRGLTFVAPTPGSDTALTFSGGAGLNIENTVIHGWGTGILFTANAKLSVVDTTVRDNSGVGIRVLPPSGGGFGETAQASIERTRLLRNGTGLQAVDTTRATIKDSLVAGNGVGVYSFANEASTQVNIENCVLTHNSTGAWATSYFGGGTIRISNSTVTNNTVGLHAVGVLGFPAGTLLSDGTNTIEGNGINIETASGTTGTYTAK